MIVSETHSKKKSCFFLFEDKISENTNKEGKRSFRLCKDGRLTLTLTCACAQRTTSFLDRASFPFRRWMALSASCGDTHVHRGNNYD